MKSRQPRSLCLMLTFRCPAQCRHCGSLSHPREHTWLDAALIARAIDEAAAAGMAEVVLTGGEPTLAGARLLDAMRRAGGHGLHVKLVTNGHWATSEAAAAACVAQWRAAGLNEANVSTGDEHARFVPLAHALRAARAFATAELPVTILLETSGRHAIGVESLAQAAAAEGLGGVAIQPWVWAPVAPLAREAYPPGLAVTAANLDAHGGCADLFTVTTVQADGAVSPCCGLGIRVAPELRGPSLRATSLAEARASAAANPLLAHIAAEGPEHLLAAAAARDVSIDWEGRYAHRCQACIRVLRDAKVRAALDDAGIAAARDREPADRG